MIRVFISILLYLISLFTQAQETGKQQEQLEYQASQLNGGIKKEVKSIEVTGSKAKETAEFVLSEKDLTFD